MITKISNYLICFFFKGFIGKGLTRHLNRIWNYLFKGLLGTILIVFLFPVLCVSASFGSILLAISAPIWMPIASVILHIYMMVIYDIDSPDNSENRYCIILEALVWNILIQGCLQPVAAVFVASVVCPLISVLIFLGNAVFFKFYF